MIDESLRSVLREHLLEKDDEELVGYEVDFGELDILKFKLSSDGKGTLAKVKAELVPQSRFGFMSGEDVKPVTGKVTLEVKRDDWKDLVDDLDSEGISIRECDIMAIVHAIGVTGPHYTIKPNARDTKVDGEIEVYVKHKGKDVALGMFMNAPPAVLFTGVFKF